LRGVGTGGKELREGWGMEASPMPPHTQSSAFAAATEAQRTLRCSMENVTLPPVTMPSASVFPVKYLPVRPQQAEGGDARRPFRAHPPLYATYMPAKNAQATMRGMDSLVHTKMDHRRWRRMGRAATCHGSIRGWRDGNVMHRPLTRLDEGLMTVTNTEKRPNHHHHHHPFVH
jgi:hypothetical protein